MAHVAKYSKGQTGGLTRHYERAKDQNTSEYIKFSNQEIDINKTNLNYNLAEEKNQLEFIKQRCSEVKCLNRKDVNVMCTWVITLPKDLNDSGNERKFFEESYKFLSERYNEQNVISAYVHMDETQPHIHFSFVPVVEDKQKGIEKVSAKECINKKDLQTFHKDLDKHMENAFSYEVGILNQATKDGNKSIVELKRKSASEMFKEASEVAKNNIYKSEEMLSNATKEVSKIKNDISFYQDRKKDLEEQINSYKGTLNTFSEIDGIGKKNPITKNITMSYDEAAKLKEQAKAYFSAHSKSLNAINNEKHTSKNYKELKERFIELKNNFNKKDKSLKLVTDVISSDPTLQKSFKEQHDIFKKNEIDRQQQKIIERDKNKSNKKTQRYER